MQTKRKQQPERVTSVDDESVLRRARVRQADIFADMDKLSATYGAEVFRIAGQRYFKWARDRAALQREIAAKEAELTKLREKVAS